jgi:hypothetical protein
MSQAPIINRQDIGTDRKDLESAEVELRRELRRLYNESYHKDPPPLKMRRISLLGFIRFIHHLSALDDLEEDARANKSVHLTLTRSARKRK